MAKTKDVWPITAGGRSTAKTGRRRSDPKDKHGRGAKHSGNKIDGYAKPKRAWWSSGSAKGPVRIGGKAHLADPPFTFLP